jgi:hypothetical protein
MKGCWILLKAFSVPIEMVIWFLSLLLLICCITFNDLYMLNYLCIPGIKTDLIMVYDLLICCWIQFANILLRILASIFIKEIGLYFFLLLLCSCLVLGWVQYWLHRESLAVFLPFLFHGKVWGMLVLVL